MIKNYGKVFSGMSNLQTHYHFQVDFKKMIQHTGGMWLIHGTKHRNGNQLQRESIGLQPRVVLRGACGYIPIFASATKGVTNSTSETIDRVIKAPCCISKLAYGIIRYVYGKTSRCAVKANNMRATVHEKITWMNTNNEHPELTATKSPNLRNNHFPNHEYLHEGSYFARTSVLIEWYFAVVSVRMANL